MARRFRLRLDQGFRPGTVTIERLALNVLPATEGWQDAAAVIGEGTGMPDQAVTLETGDIVGRGDLVIETNVGGVKTIWDTRVDVVAAGLGETLATGDSVRRPGLAIETNVGGVETVWEMHEDLAGSGPTDAHYRLTQDGIQFGNGLNGKVVPAGAQIRRGAVRRTLGATGAVAGKLIWRIGGQDVGTNIAPSSPGRDRDRFEDLARRAREAAKGRAGKLRSFEIERMLRAAGLGLEDVRVAPRRRPGLDGTDAPGSRTVLVLPVRDPKTTPRPATGALRDAVDAALAPARLLGERLHVSHPTYREVDVAAALAVEADADPDEIGAKAVEILRQRLWDILRTPDQAVPPWPAGRSVTVGEIEGLMAGIRQVVRVSDCRIGTDGTLSRVAIDLKDREIALARRIDVRVTRLIEGGEA
jgi:hypothetical protein